MEINPNLIYLALALAGAAGGGMGWVFKRGKKEGTDESCIRRIEGKVDSMEKLLKGEINSTNESHRALHNRIDKLGSKVDQHAATLHEKINDVDVQVAELRGEVRNHVKENQD